MSVGNLSPLYQLRMHKIASLRRRFAHRLIDEASFRAGLYGLGYMPGEVQLEIKEARPPAASAGTVTERIVGRIRP